jgi:fatty-acyl-CoA synthase
MGDRISFRELMPMADPLESFMAVPVWRDLAALGILARANFNRPERPDRVLGAVLAMQRWGMSLGGMVEAAAARTPNRPAIIDESGSMSFRELARRSTALAAALRERGIGRESKVGLLARNHAGFVIATVGVAKTGADLVLLNTGFATAQLTDVAEIEGVTAIIHDNEFADIVAEARVDVRLSEDDLARLVPQYREVAFAPTRRQGGIVLLTSGTTGRPKGARRDTSSGSPSGIGAFLARVPLRARSTVVNPAPLFHAWGLTNMMLALGFSSTLVLHRRFDPAQTLAAIERHRADVLIAVPVMLRRILALGPDALVNTDTSSLKIIASSGSALGSKLASDVLSRFGPVLYNIYGSTEVAMATIATPEDLLAAPATAGRVTAGTRVEILDEDAKPVPAGVSGRIFVGSPNRFGGYTTGGTKEAQRGLLSSGDVGHFDDDGRLFVDGRDDDMIVSGGENVYPGEVEELLSHHPAVADVAVVGIDDDEFGQALRAVVVVRPGATLDVETVRHFVADNLARFKVPREVVFVDELPRSVTGKILKRTLR